MKLLYYLCLFCFISYHTAAQEMAHNCSNVKRYIHSPSAQQKRTTVSAAEEQYDVRYVKLDIALNNEDVSISGSAFTKAVVVADEMSSYVFELDTLLIVDSVFVNNSKAGFTSDGDARTVLLSNPLSKGQVFDVKVYYRGLPKAGNGFFDRSGLNNFIADPWGVKVTYTLSEPYMSSDWWPCKQSLQDKIDSAAIWVTVPDSLKVGSNGLLRNITGIQGGKNRYEWHTNYPIAYYLLSVAVAPYIDYSYSIPLHGITDAMSVQNYIYNRPGALDYFKPGLDSTAEMLQYFSEVFGVYPFYKEKYGHCMAPLFGGMEHQTMSTCGNSGPGLISHELAHQWFGDYVTCATWRDIWINEGFASYAEYLFYSRFRGESVARTRLNNFHTKLLAPNNAGGTVYVDDTTNIDRIFEGKLSYNKAAAVIHMLRFELNNDSVFFSVLKTFLKKYQWGTASTDDFKKTVNTISGSNWDVFFDQWIYKEGIPVYSVEWNQLGSAAFIRLVQSATHPQSVPLFSTSIVLKLVFDDGDTLVRLYNNQAIQDYKLNTDMQIRNIITDPDNWIINEDKGAVNNPVLGIDKLIAEGVNVFPNPATDKWVLLNISKDAQLFLVDAGGRSIAADVYDVGSVKVVNAKQLQSGVYILYVKEAGKKTKTYKLFKA